MATTFSGSGHGYLQIPLGETIKFLVHENSLGLNEYEVHKISTTTGQSTRPGDHSGSPYTMSTCGLNATNDLLDGSAIADDFFAPTTFYTPESDNWAYGDAGLIICYQSGQAETTVQPFQIVRGVGIEKLTDLQTSDSDAAMLAAPNTILGRLWTVEKNQRDVLMPRQRRMLGLLGEHQVVDAFLYDDDGNITECRLRNFDDKTNAAAAGKWTDRLNQADPRTSPGGDTGEVGVYTITADNLLPRNLRTLFEQKIDADPADNLFGTGTGDGTTGSTV